MSRHCQSTILVTCPTQVLLTRNKNAENMTSRPHYVNFTFSATGRETPNKRYHNTANTLNRSTGSLRISHSDEISNRAHFERLQNKISGFTAGTTLIDMDGYTIINVNLSSGIKLLSKLPQAFIQFMDVTGKLLAKMSKTKRNKLFGKRNQMRRGCISYLFTGR